MHAPHQHDRNFHGFAGKRGMGQQNSTLVDTDVEFIADK
jgi:hypothetical protein